MTLQMKRFRSVNGTVPAESFVRTRFYRDSGKRWLDTALVLLALPALFPLMVVLVVLVAWDGGRPFYWQKRLGEGGRIFWMLKLRTMVPDAEARLAEHLARDPAARAEWNKRQKLFNDPRITHIGHFLRRASLDELPQLWNVVKGDMSLVGPRPMMPGQCDLYPGTAYYRLRPGVTGFWQITARNQSSFAGRAHYDAAYEQRVSLRTDLVVLVRTARVVLRCSGQ